MTIAEATQTLADAQRRLALAEHEADRAALPNGAEDMRVIRARREVKDARRALIELREQVDAAYVEAARPVDGATYDEPAPVVTMGEVLNIMRQHDRQQVSRRRTFR